MPRILNEFQTRAAVTIALLSLVAWTPVRAADGARQVTIVNGTHTAMMGLQVKEIRADAWPADMLNHKTLGIQKQITLWLPANPGCFYDIKAMFEDGHRVAKKHVFLCKPPSYLLTDF